MLCNYAFYMYICRRVDEAHDMILNAFRKAKKEHVQINSASYISLTSILSQMVYHNYHQYFTVSEIVQIIEGHHDYLNTGVVFESSLIPIETYTQLGSLFAYISGCDQRFNQGGFKEVGLSYLKTALELAKKSGGLPREVARLKVLIENYGEKFVLMNIKEENFSQEYEYNEYQLEDMKKLNTFLDEVLKELNNNNIIPKRLKFVYISNCSNVMFSPSNTA